MGLPILKLNLVPPPSLWRRHHMALGRGAVLLGMVCLLAVIGLTWQARNQARKAGRQAVLITSQTRDIARQETQLISELQEIDVERETPRWKLAERILTERSVPWTRITSELERNLSQDVRLKSIQRTRGNDKQVEIKLKGEAKTREAEVAFMAALHKNPFFAQVILEREAERQGGGIDFDYTLIASATPPAYTPLPTYGPAKKAAAAPPPMPTKPPIPMKSAVPRQPPVIPQPPMPGRRP
ncbi:PilN domain-containing protein [Holophaga foetida]|uniref:PilN domain-containing protein n=1 Tax=Holophaga foetida TaxID=35839 RepID=UPI0002472F4E|nr:PilN domain-containing protein [Holophaga foetida]